MEGVGCSGDLYYLDMTVWVSDSGGHDDVQPVTALHVMLCISLTQYWCVDCGLVEAVCLRNVTASFIVNNKKPKCERFHFLYV